VPGSRSVSSLTAALALAALAAGCGGSDEASTTMPAETRAENPSPQRAGDGEGRRPPVGDGEGGVELAELGEFEQPVYVAQPAAGDAEHLYVVEQCGTIRRVPIDGGEGEPFLDVSDSITCGGEQGLLSVAFAPDYAESGRLYVYYTDTAGDERIVEFRRGDDPAAADPGSARELLRIDDFASNHNGGLLLFGPDDRLYAGTGDGGGAGDPERTAQDPGSPLGKLLRIDLRGGGPEIAALGLRNPWRYSFDRETGDLWIGDVGQDELEEIDSAKRETLIGSGAGPLNFGWSAFEGSRRFNADQEAPGALGPTLEYGRDGGCSVTGGYVVRDPQLPTLFGRYLYGDFCEGELRSFTARPGRQAADDRALGLRIDQLSSFGEDAAGRLYATSLDGPVYRLEGSG
jgi:glucose/arabinose dehydrogenase